MGWVAGIASAVGSAAAAAGSAAASGAAAAGSAIGGAAASAGSTIGGVAGGAVQTIGGAAAKAASALGGAAEAGATEAVSLNPLAQLSQGLLETGDDLLKLTSEGQAASTMLHGGFSKESMLDAAKGYTNSLAGLNQDKDQPPSILAALAAGSAGGKRKEEPRQTQQPAAAPPQQAQGGEGQQRQPSRPEVRNYGQFGAAPPAQGQKPFDWIEYYNSLWRK